MGAGNGAPKMPPGAELTLRVLPEDDALVWEARNTGSATVRVWEQGNSWGWPMPRLHVEGGRFCLRPAPRIWTRNFPSSVELEPGEAARWVMRAGDFDPSALDRVRELGGGSLRVQGELRCEPSPEAIEHGVWCGALRGPAQELEPPHEWLEAGAGGA